MLAYKSRYRLLLIVFTSLLIIWLALSAIVWMARIQIVELAATESMQSAGLKDVSITIDHLDHQQSQINFLGFTLLTETGQLRVETQKTTIDYQPETLAKGHVENINIKKLILHYQQTDHTPETSEPFKLTKIITILKQSLPNYLRANALSIDNIVLNGKPFASLENKPWRLNGTSKDESLHAELSLVDDAASKQSIYLILNRDSLDMELRFAEIIGTLPAKLSLTINDNHVTGDYHLGLQALQQWVQPFARLKDDYGIKTIRGKFSINFNPNNKVETTFTATTDKLIYKPYRANNIALTLQLSHGDTLPINHLQLEDGSSLQLDTFIYDKTSLTDNKIDLTGNLKQQQKSWLFNGKLRSNNFTVTQNAQTFHLTNIAAGLTINNNTLNLNGNFSTVIPSLFDFSFKHDLKKSLGQLSIKQKQAVDLSADSHQLSQLLTPWPYPFDLLTGFITLNAKASWAQNKAFNLSSDIKFDDAGGHSGDLLFSGLSLEHKLKLLPDLHSAQSSSINLAQLDSGVSLNNVKANFLLESGATGPQPQLIIRDLYGEIFNGFFSSNKLIYDLNSSTNTFMINATNIDLAEVVKTQQLDDFKVTGSLAGSIPIELNEDGIFIKNGRFLNDVKNGSIRYNPAAGTEQLKQNPLTGIALDALKDFRYTHLEAGVNFTPEGKLAINLQLKGVSPELETDRPVHLNINTEQNLLSLLKSLRYAQGVSEKIDNNVRRQYEKNQ